MNASARLTEGLLKAHQHWNSTHDQLTGSPKSLPFAIAFSRECGTFGAAIAREVGTRLGWPVYDSELIQLIADDIGVHRRLLESVDERDENWLSECMAGFTSPLHVSSTAYFHRLVKILISLAKHGSFVIVGRGGTNVLPQATTLRIRIVAPLEYRVQAVEREDDISHDEAVNRVDEVDRERNRFVTSHCRMDAADPANYDLVLNVERFSVTECADMVLAALERLRNKSAAAKNPEVVASRAE